MGDLGYDGFRRQRAADARAAAAENKRNTEKLNAKNQRAASKSAKAGGGLRGALSFTDDDPSQSKKSTLGG